MNIMIFIVFFVFNGVVNGNGNGSLNIQVLVCICECLREVGVFFLVNDNIVDYFQLGELDYFQVEVVDKVCDLLCSLVIDIDNDYNIYEMVECVVKMYFQEVFKGCYYWQFKVVSFFNVKQLDEIYIVGLIMVCFVCLYYLVLIMGNCWIGIKFGVWVIGFFKFICVVDWVFFCFYIQEEVVMIFVDEIEKFCEFQGFGIIIKVQYYCMKWCGVKEF